MEDRQEFINTTDGQLGVSIFDVKGDPTSRAVGPGETVWLSADEQQLTANAPQRAEDNPFLIRAYKKFDPLDAEKVIEEGERAALELVVGDRPTGGGRPIAADAAKAPEGSYRSGEERGVPTP